MAKKPMPGSASNAPVRFGPGSKKDISRQESRVAGGGRMTSATQKRNTTMTQDARTRAAGEMRARNIEGHQAMTARAMAAIAASTPKAGAPKPKPTPKPKPAAKPPAKPPAKLKATPAEAAAIERANRAQAREAQFLRTTVRERPSPTRKK
jgi:histone H1/5